ncbi:MAG TPA: 30S ribosome-binding factor RbfA [Dysgonomonas sp.]|nr:30S ribosome-binding factor RbfA [Dysgonomonas sp.]
METKRQLKINRLIQKELGEIFLLQAKAMPGVLVSVSGVRISPDLGIAKAYLSIYPSAKGKELLENIKSNTKAIRYDLGQRVGKQLRIVPELVFFLDDSLDYLENIDRLLSKDNPDKEEKEE